jgi:hypothetical protein
VLGPEEGTEKDKEKDKEGPKEGEVPAAVSDRAKYDVILSAERSWASMSLKLFPGSYFVFADVSFDVSYEEAFKMTIPAHISETPWLDAKHPANHLNNVKKDSTKSFSRRSSTAIVPNSSPSKSKLVVPSGLGMSSADVGTATGGEEPPDLSKLPQVWLQISSLQGFEVKPIGRNELPLGFNSSLADIAVSAEKWPFSSESQDEASSRALQNMLTRAKTDAQLVGLQFMNLANQYKEDRKRMLNVYAAARDEVR